MLRLIHSFYSILPSLFSFFFVNLHSVCCNVFSFLLLMDYSFPKSKHLCGKNVIDNLFVNGDKLLAYPLRVVYSLSPIDYSLSETELSAPTTDIFPFEIDANTAFSECAKVPSDSSQVPQNTSLVIPKNPFTAENQSSIPAGVVHSSISSTVEPVRVMFVVPKRFYKHAVDRNRYKRLLRESYRLQQNSLIDVLKKNNLRIDMAIIVINNDFNLSYANIFPKMTKVINKIIENINH